MGAFVPAFASIADITRALRDGAATALDIAEQVFARIDRLDPALNAFVCLSRERAYREAAEADARRRSGANLGPLDGVPYAVKDIFDVAGLPTLAGTRLLGNAPAAQDCTAVQRLAAAGMVLVGKTQTVMFAADINGTNAEFGTPRNPWHAIHHTPGGSSSGSAVAVAAGLVPLALGSDTGGSIRLPAALTGTTGFKPTTGRLGRGGVRPLCWSLDAVGPITRSVADAALVFEAMQGSDPRDETTWGTAPIRPTGQIDQGIEGLQIVVCEGFCLDMVQPEVRAALEAACEVLVRLGARLVRRDLAELREASELSYDRAIDTEAYAVNRRFLEEHPGAMDPNGLWVDTGDRFLASEYYAELRRRFDLQRRFSETLGEAVAVLAPTSAQLAWPVARLGGPDGPPVSYARNTGIGNYLNWASVSVPAGFGAEGLPIGAMISARPFDDTIALRIAQAYQGATDWHNRRPSLYQADAGQAPSGPG